MEENVEQPLTESRAERALPEIAAGLFRKVSVKYPVSVTAQAIAIAIECQKAGYNPAELGKALTGDNDKLEELAETANKIHVNMKKDKPVRKYGAPTDLTPDRIKRIVESDFSIAANVITFPPDELRKILDFYPEFMQSGNRDEVLYTKFAEARLVEVRRKKEREAEKLSSTKEKSILTRLTPSRWKRSQ